MPANSKNPRFSLDLGEYRNRVIEEAHFKSMKFRKRVSMSDIIKDALGIYFDPKKKKR